MRPVDEERHAIDELDFGQASPSKRTTGQKSEVEFAARLFSWTCFGGRCLNRLSYQEP